MDAAILELGDLVGIENVIPGIDRRIGAENLFHFLDVVADAGRAPHVIDGILVAGIVGGELVGDLRPGVSEIGQFRLVELSENAGLDLAREKIGGRHHDVVAGLAGQKLRLQRVVGIERVVADLDAGFLGEFIEHRRVLIVRPIVVIDDALFRAAPAARAEERLHAQPRARRMSGKRRAMAVTSRSAARRLSTPECRRRDATP